VIHDASFAHAPLVPPATFLYMDEEEFCPPKSVMWGSGATALAIYGIGYAFMVSGIASIAQAISVF